MFSNTRVERCVVDNRVFLLGLDEFYRHAMKRYERAELLTCARRVAAALHIAPANVPIEGYYAEDEKLTEYFRLVRALQGADESRTPEVGLLLEFQRLREVTSSPLYGRPVQQGKLLPAGRDALSQALLDTRPNWTMQRLTAAAFAAAQETDDISLVGLAARLRDQVVLAALRESVVLYAEVVLGARMVPPPRREFVWQVDHDLAVQARRFIDAFNSLFGEELPAPDPSQAEQYWYAYKRNVIAGRCVRLGYDDTVSPIRHYHWAICRGANGEFAVQEFWKSEVWTTTRYRSALRIGGGCPEL